MLVANERGFCLETTSRVEVWEVLYSGIIFFFSLPSDRFNLYSCNKV